MPDPTLKIAAEEIKQILARHDIAGSVVLCSRTHNEYLLHVEPTWSVARIDGDKLRFRSKPEDFPSPAAQHEATQLTVAMMAGIGQGCHTVEGQMRQILNQLSEFLHIQIKHTREQGPPGSEKWQPGQPARPAPPETDEGGKSP